MRRRNGRKMFEVIIFVDVPALTSDEFDALLPMTTQEKRDRIKRFRFFQDARNTLIGDILARIEICRILGLSNRQLEFSVNKYGKPYLINSPHVHFNISHSGYYIALVLADKPVGIDIELIKDIELNIYERFFAADEATYIMYPDSQSLQRFFEIWTKKESRIKWEGKGLSKPLSSFSVFDNTGEDRLRYHKVFQNDEAICHTCSSIEKAPIVRIIYTDELLRYVTQVSTNAGCG